MNGNLLADKSIGFIGAGNMGAALIGGLHSNRTFGPTQIWASDIDDAKLGQLAQKRGINTTRDNKQLLAKCNIIVFSVKPQILTNVLHSIREFAREDHLFITIAAGFKTSFIEEAFQTNPRVIRAMPNTPSLISAGATGFCGGRFIQDGDLDIARAVFESVGLAVRVSEEQIDAVTGVSGSGPAYFFMMLECMTEAGFQCGLDRDVAQALAIQTCLGAAHLAAQGDKTPTQLREMVTSPNGTTFAALEALCDAEFPDAVYKAVKRAAERSKELSQD